MNDSDERQKSFWRRRPIMSFLVFAGGIFVLILAGVIAIFIIPHEMSEGEKIASLKLRQLFAQRREETLRARTDEVEVVARGHINHRFMIPRNYILTGSQSKDDDGTILEVLWPDLTPYSPVLHREFHTAFGRENRTVSISIRGVSTDVTTLLARSLSHYEPEKDYVTMPDGFHAMRGRWGRTAQGGRKYVDAFVNIQDGQLIDLIICGQEADAPYPGCKILSVVKGDIGLRVSFDRWLLDDWKLVKSRALKLIDSFEIN